jgi:hypothetical protein
VLSLKVLTETNMNENSVKGVGKGTKGGGNVPEAQGNESGSIETNQNNNPKASGDESGNENGTLTNNDPEAKVNEDESGTENSPNKGGKKDGNLRGKFLHTRIFLFL